MYPRNKGTSYKKCSEPTFEQLEVLRKFTALEKVLYDAVLDKMKEAYEKLVLQV